MYIRDMRIGDVETNAPVHLRAVNATDKQIELFINDRIRPIRDIIDKADQSIDQFANDINLSKHGQKEKIAAIKQQAWKQISEVSDKTSKTYNDYVAKLSGSLTLSEYNGGTDKVLEYLQQQELRTALYEMDKEDVFKLYKAANETGENMALVSAIENNPMNAIKPLLDEKHIEDGRQIRVERENPETISELSLVKTMASVAQEMSQKAKKALAEDGNLAE